MQEKEEEATIARGSEGLPPLEIELKKVANVVGVVGRGNGAAEVDYPSEKGPTCWTDLCSKAQGADKGEEFPL